MSMTRLFVAAWPPADVVALLAGWERPGRPGVRWTASEHWHVTLRFLGDADIEAALGALLGVDAPATEAVLGPRTRSLGRDVIMVPVAGLDAVAGAVVARTAALGRPPEHRRFRGHITLARLRGRPPDGDLVGVAVEARFAVTEVTLVASHLGHGPAHYEILARQPLVPPSSW